MPRLRAVVRPDGAVPVELLNPNDPVWATVRATEEWLQGYEVPWVELMWAGPLNRRKTAAVGWARVNGWTRTLANGCVLPDWKRMGSAGIYCANGDALEEQLSFHGIEL
jgi:hypothetical protein